MVRHKGNFGRRDLAPGEIIRLVKERYRTCNYLFNVGGIWIGIGGICVFASTRGTNQNDSALPFVVMLIGIAIFSAAFAFTLAIYRCPVCDKYLSRFRPDKLHCPRCNAQVKEAA
jgi:hypothetical protein